MHLFFADDLILFNEASLVQAQVVNSVLNDFCNFSGQKVNANKTKVFFSRNVNHLKKEQICEIMGFGCTSDLGKYLGTPLLHKRVTRGTYQFLLDTVQQRLSTWKMKTLNMACRVVLISSVIQSMPSYIMQTAKIPATTCDNIEKLARSFLWNNSGNANNMHLLTWDKVCRPKVDGGLGFRHMRINNKAFLMKIAWSLIVDRDTLWVRTVRSKYSCGNSIIPIVQKKNRALLTFGKAYVMFGRKFVTTSFGGLVMGSVSDFGVTDGSLSMINSPYMLAFLCLMLNVKEN